MFSVCVPDNMNSTVSNKNHTSPKQVHTQAPEEQPPAKNATFSSTPCLPMKPAKDALKLAVASSQQAYNPLSTISAKNHHCQL